MQETDAEPHPQTEPSEIDPISISNSATLHTKQANILKIQSQIRKLKHIVSMEKELRRNRQQFQKINNQIIHFEETLKTKRKEAYRQKMAEIELRRYERQHLTKQSNQTLAQIKHAHKERRKRMESLVNQYKQEYQQMYLSKLTKRKKLMQLDIDSIKVHESRYMQSNRWKRSSRVKTQNYQKIVQEDIKPLKNRKNQQHSPSQYDAKAERVRQLIRKRKQYGQNAERIASSIKITKDMVRRAKSHKQNLTYDPSIVEHQDLKKKHEKAKLNTNFSGDVAHQQNRELNKIAHDASPVKDKLARLGNLADGLKVKYQNGHESALDKMCNINLIRANLLLKDA